MERGESLPLDVQLEAVQASLKASLDEACGVDVQRLDTSESVRIEEVLAIASEAAKEVVSLRRKRRQMRRKPIPPVSDLGPQTEHRRFVDIKGVSWDAFAVMPSTTDARGLARLPEQYQHGWLCFESATEKRRLGPIPPNWTSVSDEELRRYRDAAQPVQHRTSPRASPPNRAD
jgi:hypothetical protein